MLDSTCPFDQLGILHLSRVLVNWQEFVSILRRYERRKGEVDSKVPGEDLADACKVPLCIGLIMNLGKFPRHNYADGSCHEVQTTFMILTKFRSCQVQFIF